MKSATVLFSLLFLFLFSCKKVEIKRISKIHTDIVAIDSNEVKVKGEIVDISTVGIFKYGHCWSTNTTPTINDYKTEFDNPSAGKEFTSTLSNLSLNVTYYVRAYTIGGDEVSYGEVETVNLSSTAGLNITSSELQAVNENSFNINGIIAGLGSLKVIDYGHCWASHTMPDLNDFKTSFGDNTDDKSFTSTLVNIKLDTTYYVRGYIKLDNSTVIYGNELSDAIPSLKVSTDGYTINSGIAVLKGTIISLGVMPVTDHGHCWSTTNSNPNINDNVISQGSVSTTGFYYSNLNLTPGNTYYYRSYAKWGNTLVYGIVKTIVY